MLHSERFVDQAPAAAYATLLEEGTYHCSLRTMYQILDRHGEVRERRNQLRHAVATRPELLATGPNQVWSWDITTLKGPAKWTSFSLYVLLDILSRSVVSITRSLTRPYTSNDNPFSDRSFGRRSRGPRFRSDSDRSRIPSDSCGASSPGTTRSTGTAGSGS